MPIALIAIPVEMPLAEMERAQLMMVGGFIMLGWVLARRQLAMRKRVNRDTRQANRALRAMREDTQPAVPLSDAPAEAQRWSVAMYDLQRELKAELDTRIAIVQSLVRHADQRIEQLRRLETENSETGDASPPGNRYATSPLTTTQTLRLAELLGAGHTSAEIADELGVAIGDVEMAMSMGKVERKQELGNK